MKYVLSVLIGLALAAPALATNLPDFPFVVAVGKTEEAVAPDTATISLEVLAFESSSEKAVAIVTATSAQIMATLAAHKLDSSSVEASDLQKSTKRHRDKNYNSLEILGYTVARDFTIQLDDISGYSPLAKALMGLDNVVEIRSRFDVKDRESIENRLLAEAMKNARQKAVTMAQAIGSEVKSVYAISQGSNFNGFLAAFGESRYGAYVAPASSPREPELVMFAPKSIDIIQTVNVVFRIKPR